MLGQKCRLLVSTFLELFRAEIEQPAGAICSFYVCAIRQNAFGVVVVCTCRAWDGRMVVLTVSSTWFRLAFVALKTFKMSPVDEHKTDSSSRSHQTFSRG